MRHVAIVLVVLVAGSLPARADEAIATSASPPGDDRRVDLRLGLYLGGNDIGDVTGPSTGLDARAGYRIGAATVFGEYGYLHVGDADTDSMHRSGRMTRAGATVRYLLADVASRGSPVGLEWWVEGGAGIERVAWAKGGVLVRPDLALGFGLDIDGRGWREPRPRHFGAFFAFRALVARAPTSTGPAMCEGPCTEATPPSRNDVAMYFLVGLHWGR